MNLEHFHVCPEATASAAVAGTQQENHPLSHYSKEGFLKTCLVTFYPS